MPRENINIRCDRCSSINTRYLDVADAEEINNFKLTCERCGASIRLKIETNTTRKIDYDD